MARKDVNLVIKARDEAAKVVNQITEAIEEFTAAQAGLNTRAEKTESTMSQLGAAFGKLNSQVNGLSIRENIALQFSKAEADIRGMEQALKETEATLKTQNRELNRAGQVAERYASKLAGATTALERQKAAVAQAKRDQRELSSAYGQAVTAQGRLAAQQAKLPGQIAKTTQAVESSRAKFEQLEAQILGTAQPTATLTRNFNAAQAALQRNEAKLGELQAKYSAINSELRGASSAVTLFGGAAEQAASNISRQERALAKISDNYTELNAQSKEAASQQGRISSSVANTTKALSAQSGKLDAAGRNYVELAQAAGIAEQALQELSGQSIGALTGELQRQRRAALEAKREYLELSDAATRMASTISRAGVPTREMADDFARIKAEAAGAKVQYNAQREGLARMTQAFQQAGSSVESLSNTQERFVQIQRRTSAAVAESRAAVTSQTAGLQRLSAAQRQAADSRLETALRRQGAAARQARPEVTGLAAAYRQLYGDTRQSLSVTQRLRGQVLSLVAAYGGFYGVINILGQTVTAYQTLEAATARLNVATGGNFQRTAQEMDFIRRTANRLGIEVGTLATEYSKFSIATQNTSLEGENTRRIFLAVAEAARVNRSSNQELSGVFVALTQIVSKGAVQMEELRQQLGDRLPGALRIMADGLNVTTGELIKMLEAGTVTEAALVPFADELNRRFGPQLGAALAGTTTALGRLKNAAFQALVTFGNGGFIDAVTEAANRLAVVLQSADFEAFANKASAAFGQLVLFVTSLVENFDLLVAAAAGFIGLKLTPFLILLGTKMGQVAFQARAMGIAAATATPAVGGLGGAAAVAATRVTLLSRAIQFLTSGTGIGLAITAIAAGIGYWASQADIATEALNEHRKVLDEVRNAYDATTGSVEEWRNAVEGLTITEARGNLRDLEAGLEQARREFVKAFLNDGETAFQQFTGLNLFTGASQDFNRAIDEVRRQWNDGTLRGQEFLDTIDAINEEFNDGSRANERYAEALIDAARRMVEFEEPIEQARQVIAALADGDIPAAQEALDDLAGSTEDLADTMEREARQATERFQEAMGDLRGVIPDLRTEMDKFNDTLVAIELGFQNALTAARQLPDAIMRIAAEQEALATRTEAVNALFQQQADRQFGGFDNGRDAAAALIRDREGFRSTPYFDVNALRVGFGSDTVTLSDGSVRTVVEGTTVSVEDANRDLYRRIDQEFGPSARAGSGGRFDTFSPQQQAALISLAYNYGSIPDRVASVIAGGGSTEDIANAIRGLGGDNGGVNRERRNEEAALFTSTAQVEPAARRQQQEAERAAELAREQQEATDQRIADGEFEIEQQRRQNAGLERQAAIEEAIRDARAADPDISEAELQTIRDQVGATYDLEEARRNATTASEDAQEAERETQNLLRQRQALQEQLNNAIESGDTELAAQLRGQIAEVNAELLAAIDNAIRLWEAVGGTEAQAAVETLRVAGQEAANFDAAAKQVYLDWSRVGDLFVSGLSNAFLSFGEAVANGENAFAAARTAFLQFASDFLREIATMIIKQAIFNALQQAFGGSPFGALIGIGAAHTGGRIGSSRAGSGNRTRHVSPAVFATAMRYHSGGMVGLSPGEVPIIAKAGEEVLTMDDPRHALNGAGRGGGGGQQGRNVKIVNAFDGSEMMQQALASPAGEEVILNYLRSNASKVRAVLG